MPSSQAAATERRNDKTVAHEPPKLKTTLKTPPKQATNPLQFVKVGPCSLYRSAQEQLQQVQETKKIKQEVRDDPEDWQSNLDNWKSSRRKRQEHIIERVVEVKKLELEEHDRQRRRSKTFSEMMEERGSRGRKLSMSLAMYHEEDVNDLSDLGIGTSSGKSSVCGDPHDDSQSVTSDRDSEIEKNHCSDVENAACERDYGNVNNNLPSGINDENLSSTMPPTDTSNLTNPSYITSDETSTSVCPEKFHNDDDNGRKYDSVNTAIAICSPEPEAEYTYEGAIRGYVSRVSQNIPRRSIKVNVDSTTRNTSNVNMEESVLMSNEEEKTMDVPMVKVDVPKRREMFERASRKTAETRANGINNNNNNNNNNGPSNDSKSIKDRLSSLEKQNTEMDDKRETNSGSAVYGLTGDMCSIRERLSHLEKQTSERESKVACSTLNEPRFGKNTEIFVNETSMSVGLDTTVSATPEDNRAAVVSTESMRINETAVNKKCKKRNLAGNDENSTPQSETSLSPEYRSSRASFHRSLDSLDTDASSGPDTFERVQSLEELDYTTRYPASSSSAERFNDTDREDSGIHTADVSSSVSQADEEVVVVVVQRPETRREISRETGTTIEKMTIMDGANEKTSSKHEELSLGDEQEICRANGSTMDRSSDFTTTTTTTTVSKQQRDTKRQTYEIQDKDKPEEVCLTTVAVHPTPLANRKSSFDEKQEVLRCSNTASDDLLLSSPSTAVTKQIPQLNLTSDEELITGLTFPLRPPTSVEPPKEKPPPPPTELSDEDNLLPDDSFKRLNSTRRIKKELRTRRSDFLGIDGMNDDYLDRQLTLTKPPDMVAILAEERRVELLNRRSYDTDSNYERDSSHERDSGVELGHTEDWSKQPVSPDMSQHSRQSSEPFGASVTSSEEDEITKKEREIIEVLEKEEQWRYGNDRDRNSDIGEKLAHKLRELEEEKMQLERDRARETLLRRRRRQEENLQNKEENPLELDEGASREQREMTRQEQEAKRTTDIAKRQNEDKKNQKDELLGIVKSSELIRQEEIADVNERRTAEERRHEDNPRVRSLELGQIETPEQRMVLSNRNEDDEFASGEVMRVERELLQLEQEELKRRRTNMVYREQRQLQLAEQLQEQWQSLQNVANGSNIGCASSRKYQAVVTVTAEPPINYRSSMPNLWLQEGQRRRPPPPPPPIPPLKPARLVEQMQRDATIRNSRIPSADSIPQQVEGGLGHSGSTNNGGQQMTKQTLQALSAVPRTRIVKNDQWVQRRKSDLPRGTLEYNYQHWLIQEAEQRRIGEQNHRSTVRKAQQHVTGTSVPHTSSTTSSKSDGKPLPDSVIQTLTQRVQNRANERPTPPPPQRRRLEQSASHEHLSSLQYQTPQHVAMLQHRKIHQFSAANNADSQEKMLSVSGKKKCSHCGDELGRGAAMIIESLRLFYHMECFKCCVCHVRLGDGLMGTDVRVRNHKLHCHNCYSSDDGVKFSCV